MNNKNGIITDCNTVRVLIRAFMSGDTSPVREQAIYAFFAAHPAGSLDDDLEQYRPMFDWYAGMSLPITTNRKSKLLKRIAVAASFILTAVTALYIAIPAKTEESQNELYAQYKGSYIIRNGKRITDIKEIYQIVTDAERRADSLTNLYPDDIEIINNINRQLANDALSGISDRALAAQILADITDSDIHSHHIQ
ncbi:MAG: hypothetical protein K2L84_01835 [Muribaculaceae bacterium]|nr:hypothetical protein [Muribaculaceae bacterium]